MPRKPKSSTGASEQARIELVVDADTKERWLAACKVRKVTMSHLIVEAVERALDPGQTEALATLGSRVLAVAEALGLR